MAEIQKKWSADEEAALKSLYPYYQRGEISKDELCGVFNRHMGSIKSKAEKLGLTVVTPTTLNFDRLATIKNRLNIDIDMTAFKQHMKGK